MKAKFRELEKDLVRANKEQHVLDEAMGKVGKAMDKETQDNYDRAKRTDRLERLAAEL